MMAVLCLCCAVLCCAVLCCAVLCSGQMYGHWSHLLCALFLVPVVTDLSPSKILRRSGSYDAVTFVSKQSFIIYVLTITVDVNGLERFKSKCCFHCFLPSPHERWALSMFIQLCVSEWVSVWESVCVWEREFVVCEWEWVCCVRESECVGGGWGGWSVWFECHVSVIDEV